MSDADKNDPNNPTDNSDNSDNSDANAPFSPYAPLPAALDYPQKPSLRDTSSYASSLEQAHPWRRHFARTIDLITSGLLLIFLVGFVLNFTLPKIGDIFVKALQFPVLGELAVYLLWLPVEALMLSLMGTTPAKWLFGIRVSHPNGDYLSYSKAFTRTMLVFFQGIGLGIPIVALFTEIFAYRRLKKTGTTLWDEATNAVVFHRKWGVFRAIVCTAAFILAAGLLSYLNTL